MNSFTADASDLADALQAASKALPATDVIPALKRFLVKPEEGGRVSVSAYDGTMFVSVAVNAESSALREPILLPPAEVMVAVSAAKGRVTVTLGGDDVHVQAAGVNVRVPATDVGAYHALPKPNAKADHHAEATASARQLAEAISAVAFAALDQGGTNPRFESVFIDLGGGVEMPCAVATDVSRLASAPFTGDVSSAAGIDGLLLGKKHALAIAAAFAERDGEASVHAGDNGALFGHEDVAVYLPLLSANFPKWRNFMPKESEIIAVACADRDELLAKATAASKLCDINSSRVTLACAARAGAVEVAGQNRASFEFACDMRVGDKFEVALQGVYLAQHLRGLGRGPVFVHFVSPLKPLSIHDGVRRCFIVPLNPKE